MMGSNWEVYFCESGEVLFYHNVLTGEYKWPHGETCTLSENLIQGDPATKQLVGSVDLETGVCHVLGDLNEDLSNDHSILLEKDETLPLEYDVNTASRNDTYPAKEGRRWKKRDNDKNFDMKRENTNDVEEEEVEQEEEVEGNEEHFYTKVESKGNASKTRVSRNSMPFKCGQCAKPFVSRWRLNKHLKQYKNKPRKIHLAARVSLNCQQCGHSFWRLADLNRHIQHYHTSLQNHHPLPKQLDKKLLMRSSPVVSPTKTPIKTNGDPLQCKRSRSHGVSPTQKRLKTNGNPLQCKSSPSPVVSSAKKKPLESKMSPTQCKYCFKCFKFPCKLKRHISRHLRIKCQYCEKRFYRKCDLSRHITYHHKDTKIPVMVNSDKRIPDRMNPDKGDSVKVVTEGKGLSNKKMRKRMNHSEKHFMCRLCDKRFAYARNIPAHVRNMHTKETHTKAKATKKIFQCGVCKKSFVSCRDVLVHVRSYHPKCDSDEVKNMSQDVCNKVKEEVHECGKCHKHFSSDKTLMKHSLVHAAEDPLDGDAHLKCHLEDAEEVDRKLWKCRNCAKEFEYYSYFIRHLSREVRRKSFKCELCFRWFLSSVYLAQHDCSKAKPKIDGASQAYSKAKPKFDGASQAYSKAKPKIIPAQQTCGKAKSKKGPAQQACSEAKPKTYPAQQACSKAKPKIDPLPQACSKAEPSEEFQCHLRTCQSTFTDKFHYVEHYKTHSDSHPFQCAMCLKCYIELSSLKRHLILNHSSSTNYSETKACQCTQCGSRFPPKGLTHHIRKAHFKLLPPTFQDGIEKHTCPECFSSFTKHANLLWHRHNEHGHLIESMTFTCNQCKTVHKNETDLRVHLRTHTGEKPYECKCGRRFTQLGTLNRHRQRKKHM